MSAAMNMVRVLHVRPNEDAKVIEVDIDDPQALPALLDGGYMEMARIHESFAMFVDEDGDRKNLPVNFFFENLGPVRGPVYFARIKPPEIGSLTDQDIQLIRRMMMDYTATHTVKVDLN